MKKCKKCGGSVEIYNSGITADYICENNYPLDNPTCNYKENIHEELENREDDNDDEM